MKYDPHGNAAKLRTYISGLETNGYDLVDENRKLILGYYRQLVSEGYSVCRVYKHLETLVRLTKRIRKPYPELMKDEIKELIIEIETTAHYSEWTKHDYKVTLRCFFRWLKGNNEKYPEEVSWISIHVKERYKLPEELLSEDEIKKMALATSNPRDRTLVQLLFETGCRISELLTVQLKNIKFDQYGAILMVTGKTSPRRVRVIASVPALANWLDFHPLKDEPEAYLFVRKKSENRYVPFSYANAFHLIKDVAAKAGIKKRVHPHLFRHSRATILANKLTEAQMKEYFGWVQGSDMASIYVHLSGRDVDDAILKIHGIKAQEEGQAEGFTARICTHCNTKNAPATRLCTNCGFTLSLDADIPKENEAKKVKAAIDVLMNDPEFKNMMLKRLMEDEAAESLE